MSEVSDFQPSATWWQKPVFQNVGLILLTVVIVYGLIYQDVVSRAKEAYLEGEKYMQWHKSPETKKAHFDSLFSKEKKRLDKQLEKEEISKVEYRKKIDVLQFDRKFNVEESSLKYAYQWYKDTYELFSPPESKWVRMARERAPESLALWKEELTAKKIAFEDYMFE